MVQVGPALDCDESDRSEHAMTTTSGTSPATKATATIPAKKVRKAAKPTPPLYPVRVVNVIYVGRDWTPKFPGQVVRYDDEVIAANPRPAQLQTIPIDDNEALPYWIPELIEEEYDDVVDDEFCDNEGGGKSFVDDFCDGGGLDLDWQTPTDAVEWFDSQLPKRSPGAMLRLAKELDLNWSRVDELRKLRDDDERLEDKLKNWCESNEYKIKKRMRHMLLAKFCPDADNGALDAYGLHGLYKKNRGVMTLATIKIDLDKWSSPESR